jgi:mitogen-activated protein kinase kinase kinase
VGISPEPDKADLLARHEEHKREVERKQKAYLSSKAPSQPRNDSYGETGYRRAGVIDFDERRVSPYEDKKADTLVPLRKPPSAPQESYTLTRINSLRKKDGDRPRAPPAVQTHGLGAVLASMGRMTSAIGTPAPSVPTPTSAGSKQTSFGSFNSPTQGKALQSVLSLFRFSVK